MPELINSGGVITFITGKCIACDTQADYSNVFGSFCHEHKNNFVREFKSIDDLKYLDCIKDERYREHCKQYVIKVSKLL